MTSECDEVRIFAVAYLGVHVWRVVNTAVESGIDSQAVDVGNSASQVLKHNVMY